MFHAPAETTEQTLNNEYYRHVVELTPEYAFVLMSIPYGGSIPNEKHEKAVQFTRVENGTCTVTRAGKTEHVPEEGRFFVPSKTFHMVVNDDPEKRTLKLYNVYIPPPPDFYQGMIQETQPDVPFTVAGYADSLFF